MNERILAIRVESECRLACRNQVCVGYRVAAGKQCDLMSQCDQAFREPGYNPFGASVVTRRNTLIQWRNLGNSHPPSSCSLKRSVIILANPHGSAQLIERRSVGGVEPAFVPRRHLFQM